VIMLANDSQYWVESGWVQIFSLVVGWVGLVQSADGLGWVGSHKMDPWTTLVCLSVCVCLSASISGNTRPIFTKFCACYL